MDAYRDSLVRALDELGRASRRRALAPVTPLEGMAVERGGRRLVNFSSNDYLGLARDPRLARAAAEGAGAGASRLVCGTLPVHERLEAALASLKGTQAALVMGSGFQTNAAVLAALLDPRAAGDAPRVFIDRLAHASMYEGLRLAGIRAQRFRHNDVAHLRELLERGGGTFRMILTESVFSMDGDRADLPALADLAAAHGAFLYVDEAHATGVLGPGGAGLCAEAAVKGRVDLVMGTFGKALGGYGAFVACDGVLVDWLVNTCRGFIFSTALPPFSAAAALAALGLLEHLDGARERLHRHSAQVREALRGLGLDTLGSDTQIIPAVLGSDAETLAGSRFLEERGVLAVGIRPPTVPPGTGRLRLALSAAHTEEDIGLLIGALQGLGRAGA
ncbi:aminotransferase class I/II-fold pyridoxal phosphate-dependent enzyme [Mesoterricola silvestris]|uniref:8-amino-7-oxononanoate synthase n=1 Tax=Mesoterricola silvestris TaxID=2927979 RepID=A0AA48GWN1_9BACT|nr:8-amino-7-oxononanoate synthase [Mesoterricola silvestris]BDU71698.1 putative 8-amino-7-oxononanoate synthase [Mesoterricola silvestris]